MTTRTELILRSREYPVSHIACIFGGKIDLKLWEIHELGYEFAKF